MNNIILILLNINISKTIQWFNNSKCRRLYKIFQIQMSILSLEVLNVFGIYSYHYLSQENKYDNIQKKNMRTFIKAKLKKSDCLTLLKSCKSVFVLVLLGLNLQMLLFSYLSIYCLFFRLPPAYLRVRRPWFQFKKFCPQQEILIILEC